LAIGLFVDKRAKATTQELLTNGKLTRDSLPKMYSTERKKIQNSLISLMNYVGTFLGDIRGGESATLAAYPPFSDHHILNDISQALASQGAATEDLKTVLNAVQGRIDSLGKPDPAALSLTEQMQRIEEINVYGAAC
jgi:hypothetical protein